jgi:hypothetical protein
MRNFNLGEHYLLFVEHNGYNITSVCKFIRVTKTGYNFLNVKTNKCIFKKHWYKCKKTNLFFVPYQIRIKDIYLK